MPILRIILDKPPAGVDYGLQKGSGSIYETVQTQRGKGNDLVFTCEMAIKQKDGKDIDFGGPFVQGPKGGRFIYIDIGSYAGQNDTPWNRRLKIPLAGIDALISKSKTPDQLTFETHVPGTAKDGGPNCATVKPFAGWKVSE